MKSTLVCLGLAGALLALNAEAQTSSGGTTSGSTGTSGNANAGGNANTSQNLPPGLERRDQLPPGLQNRNQLPPGLAQRTNNATTGSDVTGSQSGSVSNQFGTGIAPTATSRNSMTNQFSGSNTNLSATGRTNSSGNLPPGLEKRETLPPGLEKREQLPPGLERRGTDSGTTP